jgi:hypothetical protein
MKYILMLTVILTTAAFAGILHDQSLTDENDIHVFQVEGQDSSAVSFSTIDGGYNRWVACDYEPPAGETLELRGFGSHYCYFDDVSALGDMNFEIYEDDLNSAPLDAISVNVTDITETNTGWVSPTSGSQIFFGEMIFNHSDWFDGLVGGNAYWIAAQMDSSDNVFMFAVDHDYWDEAYIYHDEAVWTPVSQAWPGNDFDLAMRFRGGGWSAIESVSLGELKASFR